MSENYAVYEIMWKNMTEGDGPEMTVLMLRMCFACHVTEATVTH